MFGIALFYPMQALADPPESECIPYLQQQYFQARTNATTCGTDAGMMATFPWSNNSAFRCSGGRAQVTGAGQLSAFQQCAVNYACAAQFYACAMTQKNSGMGCRDAMNSCNRQ